PRKRRRHRSRRSRGRCCRRWIRRQHHGRARRTNSRRPRCRRWQRPRRRRMGIIGCSHSAGDTGVRDGTRPVGGLAMTNVTLRSGSSETLGGGDDPLATQLMARRTRTQSLLRQLTDPASLIPTYIGVVVALAGFGLIGYSWAKVAGLVDVWRQMPYLVSAGFAGLALIGLAYGAISIHLGRRQDAVHRAEVEELVRTAATLAEELRTGRRALPGGRRLG